MSKHHITRALELFYGPAYYGRARRAPGVPIQPINFVDFGVIVLADANGVVESQDLTALGVFSGAGIAGVLAAGGVATFDVPRNVVAAWTTNAVLTITGTDQYGEPLVESSAGGSAALTGKKAFKTITGVSTDTNITALTVGTGVLIGLPHRVDRGGLIIAKVTNATDAATFLPAVTTDPATAVTGDVRGTVSFAAAPDDTRSFAVFYKIADVRSKVGAYGVAQFS